MVKKNLLITFDYELFLGRRSGTANECLLEPTNSIADILGKHKVTGIFFVDTMYLIRLKDMAADNEKCAQDLKLIIQQLVNLLQAGHYIFPHLHTHWLDAIYDPLSNQWNLEKINRYRFHNVDPETRKTAFTQSVEILTEIAKKSGIPATIDGFRAGGWSIQPFSDFKPSFMQHKIGYEFSVLTGFYQFTDAQYFDFSDAPLDSIYRFEDEVTRK